jgi:hypothetical protein
MAAPFLAGHVAQGQHQIAVVLLEFEVVGAHRAPRLDLAAIS